MKELEAKKKICPHMCTASAIKVTALQIASAPVDDINQAATISLCQGSNCMMWTRNQKLETSTADHKPEGDGWTHAVIDELPAKWQRYVPDDGYCGLTNHGC